MTATQTRQVLHLLRERGKDGLTPLEALDRAQCFRLAARINDLRKEGWEIETLTEKRGGKRFARYVLHPERTLGL